MEIIECVSCLTHDYRQGFLHLGVTVLSDPLTLYPVPLHPESWR